MSTELIPATEAKAIVLQVLSTRDSQNLSDITNQIHTAIPKGETSIYVDTLTNNTKARLEELGYKVTSQPDRNGPDSYTISWK